MLKSYYFVTMFAEKKYNDVLKIKYQAEFGNGTIPYRIYRTSS